MSSGSWDESGKCSELGGGVHQICIKDIANSAQGFSSSTGQSDWSNQRGVIIIVYVWVLGHCIMRKIKQLEIKKY